MEKLRAKAVITIDENMEETYIYIEVFNEQNHQVGTFQIIENLSEETEEEIEIRVTSEENINKLMKLPLLYKQHKIIQDLHQEHMNSSNSNIYGDDLKGWMDTEEDYGFTWEGYEYYLKAHAKENPEFNEVLSWDNGNFWMGWDFLSMYNLQDNRPKCPHCAKVVTDIIVVSGNETVYDYNEETGKFEEGNFIECVTIHKCPECNEEIHFLKRDGEPDINIELERN